MLEPVLMKKGPAAFGYANAHIFLNQNRSKMYANYREHPNSSFSSQGKFNCWSDYWCETLRSEERRLAAVVTPTPKNEHNQAFLSWLICFALQPEVRPILSSFSSHELANTEGDQ
jgi:hypothetical protein